MTRWVFLTTVLVGACYEPRYRDCELTCATSGICPSGLTCFAGACRVPGTGTGCGSGFTACETPDAPQMDAPDAAIDAPDDLDDDDDSIPDVSDNCPNHANADQFDEEGDNVGDVCDPCPISSNNANSDGDAVGDACDPNPTVGGDQIVRFYNFRAAPSDLQQMVGTWSFDGTARIVGTLDMRAILGMPSVPAKPNTITTRVTIDNLIGTSSRSIGAIDELSMGNLGGVSCAFGNDAAGAQAMFIVNWSMSQVLGASPVTFGTNTVTQLIQTRVDANTYRCQAPPLSTMTVQNDISGVTGGQFGLFALNISAHFDYLMVVTSP